MLLRLVVIFLIGSLLLSLKGGWGDYQVHTMLSLYGLSLAVIIGSLAEWRNKTRNMKVISRVLLCMPFAWGAYLLADFLLKPECIKRAQYSPHMCEQFTLSDFLVTSVFLVLLPAVYFFIWKSKKNNPNPLA